VAVNNADESGRLMDVLKQHDLPTLDLSNNEVAKLHLRHLVGGHAPQAEHEQVYRFEFPEKPGALMKFLETMGQDWNISLFHYRNHGADYGRVLVGMQVPPEDKTEFKAFLDNLGYPYWDESVNPAYALFLG
jgi:threonine dehydratase